VKGGVVRRRETERKENIRSWEVKEVQVGVCVGGK
jgi:hypothetical protein